MSLSPTLNSFGHVKCEVRVLQAGEEEFTLPVNYSPQYTTWISLTGRCFSSSVQLSIPALIHLKTLLKSQVLWRWPVAPVLCLGCSELQVILGHISRSCPKKQNSKTTTKRKHKKKQYLNSEQNKNRFIFLSPSLFGQKQSDMWGLFKYLFLYLKHSFESVQNNSKVLNEEVRAGTGGKN